ncbi:hypothetical protein JVX90_18360 [Gordonia sp. PDNC005]|uniref:hypothetical protein n=1 Tax=unclassified Gordonia (in: high G+C Gram-positive bacteria) TaxID=2657482 RepID=UPI00196243CB|nr:hypothetical protein [Gordonia sp. PDNC005]QRY62317.1 hypothetical protein JVX90_18360 [Gordonia sp. PDNC005]
MHDLSEQEPGKGFYALHAYPTAHVLRTSESDEGTALSAEFYFDYTSTHVIMGRYGYCAVTQKFAEEMAPMQFSGYTLGSATAKVWEYAEEGVEVILPEIALLVVTGKLMRDDFSRGHRGILVVSHRVLQFISERDPEVAAYAREVGPDGRRIRKWLTT